MNLIDIWAPRWHDRTLLIADWKIGHGINEVRVLAKKRDGSLYYPIPFRVSGEKLRSYPIDDKKMRVVPLDDLL